MSLWHRHPGVRSGGDLSVGERAADRMRNGMGSWMFMGAATVFLVAWMWTGALGIDRSPFFKLNLLLSCFAALQGAILLIAAKRADQVSSEVALHTQGNTDTLTAQSEEILTLQRQQMAILDALQHLNAELDLAREGHGEPGLAAVLAEAQGARADVQSLRDILATALTGSAQARKEAGK
jgi:uncharacterized membrane protein